MCVWCVCVCVCCVIAMVNYMLAWRFSYASKMSPVNILNKCRCRCECDCCGNCCSCCRQTYRCCHSKAVCNNECYQCMASVVLIMQGMMSVVLPSQLLLFGVTFIKHARLRRYSRLVMTWSAVAHTLMLFVCWDTAKQDDLYEFRKESKGRLYVRCLHFFMLVCGMCAVAMYVAIYFESKRSHKRVRNSKKGRMSIVPLTSF